MLDAGVAREVARAVLPVGLYSSMYATCNARSLMHFLGLRTQHELATVPSFPQREIEMVGEQMEAEWARLMPLTHAAFNANGGWRRSALQRAVRHRCTDQPSEVSVLRHFEKFI